MGIEEPELTIPPKVCTCCNGIIKNDDKWDMLLNPLRLYHKVCWDTHIRLPERCDWDTHIRLPVLQRLGIPDELT